MELRTPSRKRHAQAAENGLFGHGQHRSGLRRHLRDHVVDLALQFILRNHPVDQSQVARALGGHRLAGEHQFERELGAHDVRKNRRGQRRKNAQLDFRLREARLGRRDHQVAQRGQFRASAETPGR